MDSATQHKFVDYGVPHFDRSREILEKHPEIRQLFGPIPWLSSMVILALFVLQIGTAILLRDSSWWVILLAAFSIGAAADHALLVLIHECGHNLVLRTKRENILMALFANIPQLLPTAMGFRKYHAIHHSHLGVTHFDGDLAVPWEYRLIGNSPWRKTIWLALFWAFEGLRPLRLHKSLQGYKGWIALNGIVQLVFGVAFGYVFGWQAVAFLFLSFSFAIGLHPLGARWIQEHYRVPGVPDDQETFSYYGPLNILALNMGYHNEHHDFIRVPWSKLPKVRELAPEYYDNLYYYKSWTKLLFQFIFDRRVDLTSRTIRHCPCHAPESPKKATAA